MPPACFLGLTFLSVFAVADPSALPQDQVLAVVGCGTGCRVENEQLSLPERMADGWLRVKVRQRIWVQRCDWETNPLSCWDEPGAGRAGPPLQEVWLFADCKGEKFARGIEEDRSDASEQNVFHQEGEWKGTPAFQTYLGNPFMQWAKLCPSEAKEGEYQMRSILDSLRNLFQ